MSYQEELARLQEAKASMRQSIINKGVDVPENAKIETYPSYIAQIQTTPPLPDVPDLSKVLTPQDLLDIQTIIASGAASEKFSLGQKLLISYGDYTMPFEIVGFNDVLVQVNGQEITAYALNLLSEYTSDETTKYASDNGIEYSASLLRTFIITECQNKVDSNFLTALGNTKTQTYKSDGTTDIVYDKLFAPSMTQLGVPIGDYNATGQKAIEGPVFTSYQDATNDLRIKKSVNETTTAQSYWTRTLFLRFNNFPEHIFTSGEPRFSAHTNLIPVAIACNLIGIK